MWQLRKFLRLASSDRQLLLQAIALLSLIRLGLWRTSLQNLRSRLAQLLADDNSPLPPMAVDRIVWAVEAACRLQPGKVKCLARALATQHLLSRYGYAAQLRIGVQKGTNGRLQAHAWVEHEGKVVNGGLSNLSKFVPLAALEVEA